MPKHKYSEIGTVTIKPEFAAPNLVGAIAAHCLATVKKIKLVAEIGLKTSPAYAQAVYPDLMAHPEAGPNIRTYMGDPAGKRMVLLVFEGPGVVENLAKAKIELRRPFLLTPPSTTKNVLHIPKDRNELVANMRALLKLYQGSHLHFTQVNRQMIEDILNFNLGYQVVTEVLTKKPKAKPGSDMLEVLQRSSGQSVLDLVRLLELKGAATPSLGQALKKGQLVFFTGGTLDKTRSTSVINILAEELVHEGYPKFATARQVFKAQQNEFIAEREKAIEEGRDRVKPARYGRLAGRRVRGRSTFDDDRYSIGH